MKLEKKRYEDLVILKFVGELESVNLPAFTERMEKWIAAGDVRFILDLRLLTFINSSAFGYIMRLRKVLAEKGGGVVIARPSKFMRKTIKTYGVEDLLPCFESVEDAILHFKKGAEVGRMVLLEEEPDQTLQGEVPVIFCPVVKGGQPPANQVGRLVSLYEDGLMFHYDAQRNLDPVELQVAVGTRLREKFRIPFLDKHRWFEIVGKVARVDVFQDEEDGERRTLAIRTKHEEVDARDRADLLRYMGDQDDLRREVKGA